MKRSCSLLAVALAIWLTTVVASGCDMPSVAKKTPAPTVTPMSSVEKQFFLRAKKTRDGVLRHWKAITAITKAAGNNTAALTSAQKDEIERHRQAVFASLHKWNGFNDYTSRMKPTVTAWFRLMRGYQDATNSMGDLLWMPSSSHKAAFGKAMDRCSLLEKRYRRLGIAFVKTTTVAE